MKLTAIKLIYFSPTGTTRSVIESIARGIDPDSIAALDLTLPEAGIQVEVCSHNDDLEKAVGFGQTIRQKLDAVGVLDDIPALSVPGRFPYKKWGPSPLTSPVTHEQICIKCAECAGVCPKAVITIGDTVKTEAAGCIHCTACVKICPTGARVWEDSGIKNIAAWLSTKYYERKEPEMFL